MLRIRRARIEDASIITKNRIEAYNKDSRDFGSGKDGGPTDYDSITATLEGIKDKSNIYYVIMLNTEIIGSFWLNKIQEAQYELEDLVIHPKYQNNGYGKKVIKAMEKKHKEIEIWTLGTPKYSIKNRHLYEKMGYIQNGESDDGFLILYKKVKQIKNENAIRRH